MRGPFDYRLRADQPDVEVGSLLRVPFGGRRSLGVVVGLSDRSELDPDRLIEPEAVLPDGLPADLVALAHWMAREYCSTPARAFGLLLAPGSASGVRTRHMLVARLTEAGHEALADDAAAAPGARPLTRRQRELLAALQAARGRPASSAGSLDSIRRLERARPRGAELRPDPPPPRAAPDRDCGSPRAGADARSAGGAGPDPDCPGRRRWRAVPASRRDRLGQDRGVPGGGGGGAGGGARRDRARARDRPHAADHGTLRGQVRRRRGRDALGPEPGPALRRVAPPAPRRGTGVRGTALGRVRAAERHRPDRRGRGARGVLQARGRPPLRRPGGGRAASPRPRRRAGGGERHAAPGERGEAAAPAAADPCRRPPAARGRGARHARIAPPPPPADQDGAGRSPAKQRQGDHAPQPPRLVELPLLPCLRRGVDVPELRGRAGAPPHGDFMACHHCGHRQPVPHRCPKCASVALARHGAGTERLEHELAGALGDADFPILRLDATPRGSVPAPGP